MIRVAGIFRVEAAEGGLKFLRVARMKDFQHTGIFAEVRPSARRIRGY
jgi:hypothetical protein